jgi:hypothetical protein
LSSDRFLAFVWVFILFLLQNLLNYLFPGKCPPLLLMAVIFYSLREGALFGSVLGAAAGFLLELFGQGGFGVWILNLAAVGALSGYASSKIFQDSLLTEIILPGLAFYLSTLAEIVFLQARAGVFSGWDALGGAFLFWPLLGSLVFSPALFGWLQKTSSSRRVRARKIYR